MKINTVDGAVFEGRTPEAVVKKMRDAAWRWQDKKGQYMREVVYAVWGITGLEYRVKLRGRLSAVRFLKYLQDAGMIRRIA